MRIPGHRAAALVALSLSLGALGCGPREETGPSSPPEARGGAVPEDEESAYARHRALADRAGREGRWADVIRELREAIRVGPYVEEDHYLLGSVWLRYGDLDAMIQYFREQEARDPKPQTSHFFVGRALAAQGDLDGAIEEYERALAIDPAHELSHQAWGEALESRGELEEAERHYRRAVAIDPTFEFGWESLLRFVEAHGTAERLAATRRAAAEADHDPRHRPYYWARTLAEEGREEAARAELRRVLAADPAFQPARDLAAELGLELQE